MRRWMLAVLCVAMIGAAEDPKAGPKLKVDAPASVRALLPKSEAYRQSLLQSLPRQIAAEQKRLRLVRAGRIDGKSNGTMYPGNLAKERWNFETAADKDRQIAVQEGVVASLERRLAAAKDPRAILCPPLGVDDLKVGAIGEVPRLTVKQVIGGREMLVELWPAIPGDPSVTDARRIDAYLVGMSTEGLTDGAEVDMRDRGLEFTGTHRFETVAGGARTVLKGTPIDPNTFVDLAAK